MAETDEPAARAPAEAATRAAEAVFAGPGELAARCRALDWSATPLGPVSAWPASLRTAAALALRSGFPSILVWGPDRVQLYNDAYAALIGDKHPAALGRPTHESWPEIHAQQEAIFARVFAGETVTLSDAPYRFDRRGRLEEAYFDATFVPVPLDAGEGAGAIGGSLSTLFETTARVAAGTFRDEHARLTQAERAAWSAAEEAGTYLRQVLEQAPVAISTFRGPEHVFTSANAMFRALTGKREPIVGRSVREVQPELEGTGFYDLLDRVYRTGEPYVGTEMPAPIDRDGATETAYFNFTYQPITDAAGQVTGIVSVATDVTDLVLARRREREARERATTILESISDAFYAVDAGFRFTYVNRRAGELWGRPADALLGRHYWTEFPEAVGTESHRMHLAAMADRRPMHYETRSPLLGRWVEVSIYPEAGGGLSCYFRDISGRKAADAERERLLRAEREARAEAEAERARAEEASQAKSEFLATMSHELRTPINAIVGYAQLIEIGVAGPVTAQQREYLARLAATSEHLRGLVDDVLDLAKIDAGGMSVARDPAMTGALVATALDLVRPQAIARGVRLVDERPGEAGEPFVGDEHRVRQILANLLSNAVKFTPAGGTVAVLCGRSESTPAEALLRGAGPWTFVRVADTGIGIPAEELGQLFAPFHQVDSGRTRTAGGTGLGLAISRRLARLMGGDLTVESTPGAGSAFTLWLPAASDTRGTGGGAESAAERGARARQEPGGGRVHGLAEIGTHLRECLEEIIAAHAARLRADAAIPQAAHLRRSELEDHQLSFLVDVAQTLVVIEETGGPESDLLRDGSTIQRVVAELHGAMRARRGWTEAQLAREYEVLGEELAAVVRRHVPEGSGDASLALDVLEQLVERARATGLAALRRAAHEGAADR